MSVDKQAILKALKEDPPAEVAKAHGLTSKQVIKIRDNFLLSKLDKEKVGGMLADKERKTVARELGVPVSVIDRLMKKKVNGGSTVDVGRYL